MRVADKIFEQLKKEVDTVFYLPGGGSAYLVDALGMSGLQAVSCLNEQGAGFAAVGYAQHKGFGVCLTTSGPGATNAITPCLAAWMDSVPVLFISGQVQIKWLAFPGMRSRGPQEADIISIVRPITKLVWQSLVAKNIMETLEDLIYACKSGRPGPCWLDIPLDVQNADI